MRSVILRDEAPSVAVRVLPGKTVQTRDDLAPTVSELFFGGQLIPNLDAEQAARLASAGVVEVLYGES